MQCNFQSEVHSLQKEFNVILHTWTVLLQTLYMYQHMYVLAHMHVYTPDTGQKLFSLYII
jgi:hypothetical protein